MVGWISNKSQSAKALHNAVPLSNFTPQQTSTTGNRIEVGHGSERFPYIPYAPRMIPEYFLYTHGHHIRIVDENYFEHAQQIFGASECRADQRVCS